VSMSMALYTTYRWNVKKIKQYKSWLKMFLYDSNYYKKLEK